MKNILIILVTFFTISAKAQNKTADTIIVDGVCEMCKDRIESALDVNGIWVADWNLETKELYVVYKSKKISKEQICTLLNEAGHDTEVSKATEEEYLQVHNCCMYRDEKVKAQHAKSEENE